MIWQRKDPAADHFVKFGHQDSRIAKLETDLFMLCEGLLPFIQAIDPGATHLAVSLQRIIEDRAPDK